MQKRPERAASFFAGCSECPVILRRDTGLWPEELQRQAIQVSVSRIVCFEFTVWTARASG